MGKEPVNVYMPHGSRMRLGGLGVTLQAPSPVRETGLVPPIKVDDKKVIAFLLRYPGTARISAQEVYDKGHLPAHKIQAMGHDVRIPKVDDKGKPVKGDDGKPVVEVLPGELQPDTRLPPGAPDLRKMSIAELRDLADDFVDAEGKKAPIHLPAKAAKDEMVEVIEDAYIERHKAIGKLASRSKTSLPTNPDPRKAK